MMVDNHVPSGNKAKLYIDNCTVVLLGSPQIKETTQEQYLTPSSNSHATLQDQ